MPSFHNYIILGDDIVIKDDSVAREYMMLMQKFGVELSMNKTHVSKDYYEFAKRWICPLGEVSPIPISGIVKNFTNVGVIFQILYQLCAVRNLIQFQSGTFSTGFCEFYSDLTKSLQSLPGKFPSLHLRRFRFVKSKTVYSMIYPLISLMRWRDKIMTNEEMRNFLSQLRLADRDMELPLPCPIRFLQIAIERRVILVMKELLNASFYKLEVININFPFSDIKPMVLGLRSIKRKFLKFAEKFRITQVLNIQDFEEAVLGYDVELLSSREGSSPTKKMNNFTRFARRVLQKVKSLRGGGEQLFISNQYIRNNILNRWVKMEKFHY